MPKGGFPDTGNGWYSKELKLEEWYKFNCAMWIHHNFLEQLPTFLVTILISGASFPLIAAILGLFNVFAWIVYGIGYFKQGAHGRSTGALFGNFIFLGLTYLSIASFFFTFRDSTLLFPLIAIFNLTITCFVIGFLVSAGTREHIMNELFVQKFIDNRKSMIQ